MLAEILHRIAGEDSGHSSYRPRASLAGPERCSRQLTYWRMGKDSRPLPGRAVMVLDDSSWHEELTKNWIRKTAFSLHSEQMPIEVKWEGFDFSIKGSIDGIITDITDQEYLFEHKAVNHFSFNDYAQGKKIPLDYITQCCVYLRGINEVMPIEKAILLIKNKNTAQFCEYLLSYSLPNDLCRLERLWDSRRGLVPASLSLEFPNVVKNAFDKFQEVEDSFNNKTLPPRQYSKSSWRCEYCPFEEVCWEDYEKELISLVKGREEIEDAEDLCAYYLEVSSNHQELGKEKEELRDKIIKILREKGVAEGIAGRYIVRQIIAEISRIDHDLLRTLIDPDILEKAKKEVFQERLIISLKKEG
ncbi:TPA: hypothetical protein DCX15_00940 [bacterium]|nr:hypothetical protein [bacterium]